MNNRNLFSKAHFLAVTVLMLGCASSSNSVIIDDPPACEEDNPEKAKQVLQTYCYRCHGQAEPATAGLDVLDVADMVTRGVVIAYDPENSLLYQRASSQSMPPATEEPRPGEADIAALKKWISCGAKGFSDISTTRPWISPAEMLDGMRADLEQNVTEGQRKHARYFVLTHLWNAGVEDGDLETYRKALFKLLNSLSRGPNIVVPVAVDKHKTVYRIDLTDYKWEPQANGTPSGDLWERLLGQYPFGQLFLNDENNVYLAEETGSQLPWIHMDWFVNQASNTPLYYDMLRLPTKLSDLEKEIGVDRLANIANGIALRAGFNGSDVALENRVIERHDSLFGPYWISYDFASSEGLGNIFQNPLGPVSEPPKPFQFQHNGGEVIFSLPNGLHGYMIVNAKGARLPVAPTSIVADPLRADGVRAGISCFSCHQEGIKDASDEVRAQYDPPSANVPLDVVQAVRDLYRGADEFHAAQQSDRNLYLAAINAADAAAVTGEPITSLSSNFDASLDLRRAAAELWIPVEKLQYNTTVLALFPPLDGSTSTTVKRGVFEGSYHEAVCALGFATHFAKGAIQPCVP